MRPQYPVSPTYARRRPSRGESKVAGLEEPDTSGVFFRLGRDLASYFEGVSPAATPAANCWMHWRLKRAPAMPVVPEENRIAWGQFRAGRLP
jgi:hypothetical protein